MSVCASVCFFVPSWGTRNRVDWRYLMKQSKITSFLKVQILFGVLGLWLLLLAWVTGERWRVIFEHDTYFVCFNCLDFFILVLLSTHVHRFSVSLMLLILIRSGVEIFSFSAKLLPQQACSDLNYTIVIHLLRYIFLWYNKMSCHTNSSGTKKINVWRKIGNIFLLLFSLDYSSCV